MQLTIPNFASAQVLVVGDLMTDRYWHGNTSRISPEAPVPIVQVQQMEERPGGAGNVALNVAALGSHASLLSIVGDDATADQLTQHLTSAGVIVGLQRIPNLATLVKLRILSLHQQLLRLDFEQPIPFSADEQLIAAYQQHLAQAQVVILSDYGKGVLRHVSRLITMAKQAGVPVLIDPKGSDFSIYRGATLLTPNRKEFEQVVGPCATEAELVVKGENLLRACQLEALLITRGEQGMTLLQANLPALHLSATAKEVYDVTGAGDTVIAVMAAALAAQEPLGVAAALANAAAGVVISKLGAATVSIAELRRALHQTPTADKGVLAAQELKMAIADAQAHGERIVMTNGCFDILHAGHITYLEQAKALGDRLIVAVNDDASVARLKGPGRPINNLAERMQVLAGLRAVDWVVPFSEDTPAHIIETLLPDVLVKGGDYSIASMVGANSILANGGAVHILDFVEGCSTSNVVKRILDTRAII